MYIPEISVWARSYFCMLRWWSFTGFVPVGFGIVKQRIGFGHTLCPLNARFSLILHFFISTCSCMVNSLLFIYHFGSCCVYVVFIANCLKDIGDHYWTVWDSRLYMFCEILPLCLIYCVPNLKSLVPFAMAANFSLIFGKLS